MTIGQDLYAAVSAMQLLESRLEASINIVDGEDDEGFPLMKDQFILGSAKKALAQIKQDLRGTYQKWLYEGYWHIAIDEEVGA